jgi:hypothetical protein
MDLFISNDKNDKILSIYCRYVTPAFNAAIDSPINPLFCNKILQILSGNDVGEKQNHTCFLVLCIVI